MIAASYSGKYRQVSLYREQTTEITRLSLQMNDPVSRGGMHSKGRYVHEQEPDQLLMQREPGRLGAFTSTPEVLQRLTRYNSIWLTVPQSN